MGSRLRRALALLLLAAAVAAGPAVAAGRVVAVGDIHGALESFLTLLQRAGLTDSEGHWIAGPSVLVQTGDFLDRGARVREVMDLLRRLEREAAADGGRVVVLLGNHEVMNMVGELRDADPAAFAAFAGPDSERLRDAAYKRWRKFQRLRARRAGLSAPSFPSEVHDAWLAARPLGLIEYLEAMGPQGDYGTWLRRLPVAVQVDDTIFLHGGISPEQAEQELDQLTLTVHEEIRSADRLRQEMIEAQLILPTFRRSEVSEMLAAEIGLERSRRGADEEPGERELQLIAFARRLDELLVDTYAFGENGPLWFRGFAKWSDELLQPYLGPYLEKRGARRIVAAHTPSTRGRIEERLGGALYLIDTGMQSAVYTGGRGSALEIVANGVRQIYERPDPPAVEAAGALLVPDLGPEDDTPPPFAGGTPPRRLLGADGERLPVQSDADLVRLLKSGRVLEKTPLGVGITQPDRLLLEFEGLRIRAVFHDVEIQKTGARLQGRGLVADFRDSYRSQVAAFQVARLLQMDNVPPAVIRQVEGVRGSVALWIENSFMERDRVQRQWPHPQAFLKTRAFYDLRVFDNLIANIDRNQTNIIYDGFWKLWLIDHTRAFGRSGKLPNPERVVRCSRQLWKQILALEETTVLGYLKGILTRPEIKAMMKRRDRLVELIRAMIAERGEDAVLFDRLAPPAAGDDEDDAAITELPPG